MKIARFGNGFASSSPHLPSFFSNITNFKRFRYILVIISHILNCRYATNRGYGGLMPPSHQRLANQRNLALDSQELLHLYGF